MVRGMKTTKTAKKTSLSLRRESLRRIQGLDLVRGGIHFAPCMGCTGTDTW